MNAMTTPTAQPTGMSTSAAFARCYQLLGTAFAYPDSDIANAVKTGEFRDALVEAAISADGELEGAFAPRSGALVLDVEDAMAALEADYLAAFELDVPKRVVSLYEGSYAGGCDRSAILLEVKSFYQHFGLAISEQMREAEDHLAAELEFMQFLAIKQAIAEADNADSAPYRRAQRDFLERHLAVWLPRLAIAVAEVDSDFYRTLAWLSAAVVGRHLVALKGEELAP